jgi:hypothetical protein
MSARLQIAQTQERNKVMDSAGLTIWIIAIMITVVIALNIGRKKKHSRGTDDHDQSG